MMNHIVSNHQLLTCATSGTALDFYGWQSLSEGPLFTLNVGSPSMQFTNEKDQNELNPRTPRCVSSIVLGTAKIVVTIDNALRVYTLDFNDDE